MLYLSLSGKREFYEYKYAPVGFKLPTLLEEEVNAY